MKAMQVHALFDGAQWRSSHTLCWSNDGRLMAADSHPLDSQAINRVGEAAWVLPGIANLHSHAFQRAMAGLAERQASDEDSFWTWREWMYRFSAVLAPDDVRAIARMLYVEMLEAGYTSVCEFHYLHHDADGRPYATPTAMSEALIAAADDAGIRLTLLPVLYQRGGFDGRVLNERQRRFGNSTDAFLRLLDDLRARESSTVRVGMAFHSLRAVDEATMREVLAALPDPSAPVHLHIAEQQAEVVDCLATHGARPVAWLLDHFNVDQRWTLVHATHLDDGEVRGIARSGATVALCPSTEANLGDGLFPLRAFLAAGGRFGVGSDSHVSVSPVEELRWLEYGQRLIEQKRNRAILGEGSTGEALVARCAESAAAAVGQPIGVLEDGRPADFLVLDAREPSLQSATPRDAVDRFLFSGNRPLVRDVFVGGRHVVVEGRHPLRESAQAAYANSMRRLLSP